MNKYDVDNLLNQILLDVGAGVGVTEEDRAIQFIALSFNEGRELFFISLRKRRRRRDRSI